MKNILIAANVLLLGIIFFMSCNLSDQKVPRKADDTSACLDTTTCGRKTCCAYLGQDVPGHVDGAILTQFSAAYSSDHAKSRVGYAIDPGTSAIDALSVTFDLDQIKSLICHMERAAYCTAGCDTARLGIKFYFVKYDPSVQNLPDDLQGLVTAQQNKHTLAMVPAYLKGDAWFDFDYTNVNAGCNLKPDTATHHVPGLMNLNGSNHGGIGPPPDPGTFPTVER